MVCVLPTNTAPISRSAVMTAASSVAMRPLYKGDPYSTENIMIHEFAHAIHSLGLRSVDPTFQPRLSKVYEDAKAKGLWKGTYAISNISEYWARAIAPQ